MAWQDKIRNADCELCPLHESAEYVCLMGQGSRRARVMIVGEAPGEREDEEHVAFVGPSGQLLRRALHEEAGLRDRDCYITNAVKCRPPDNDLPKSAVKVCAPEYLSQELARVEPDFILAVGNSPLQALLGRSGITKHRGSPVSLPGSGAVVLPTFHPAYVLRSPQHEPTFRADLQRLGRMVRGEDSPAEPTKVKIVQTASQLRWLRRKLDEAPVISFDLETSSEGTGKDHRYHKPWDDNGQIVMVGFTWEEGMGVAVPLHHVQSPWRDPDAVLRFLKAPLEDKSKKLVAHNGKFDSTWLAAKGVFVRQTFDTMLAAHLLDENRAKGLKPLSQILLGADAYDVGEDLKDAFNMPLRRISIYQAKDVDYTLRLYYLFRKQLIAEPRLRKVFQRLMMPASNALVKVETIGMYCVGKNVKRQLKLKEKERDEVEAELRSFLPVEVRDTFNFRSPQQVGKWLFGDLGLDMIKTTKTGAPSTDEDVMLQLASQHPAPALLLRYRSLESKDIRTYLKSWDEKRDRRSRIHTNYKLFGTVTGRLASDKPNLQQVPRDATMRTCFGAPDGWAFMESDYAQVELRIAAMLSRDPTLLRIFTTGGDPHLTTAAEVSGMSEAEVTKSDASGATEWRKKAKPVNFGFLYGMGEQKFIDYARTNYGVDVSPKEAHRYRTRFFDLYSELPRWHDRQRRLVKALGRVHSPIGRIRHLPDVYSGDKKVRAEAERQAINSPVQSFASDLMLLSLVRLSDRLDPRRCRIVGSVHDALLFEVHRSYLHEAAPIVKETMEDLAEVERLFSVDITVPIVVDMKYGQFWGATEGELCV